MGSAAAAGACMVAETAEAGGGVTCATDTCALDAEDGIGVDLALSIANNASTWSRWFTAVLAWMTYGIASDGLVTTPADDVTPLFRRKDTRAAMLFGRAFENALAAFFRHQDSAAALFREWAVFREAGLQYSNGDTWDRMLQQGIQLLERFAQDDRVHIRQPRRSLQVKFTRPVPPANDFVAYVDALGKLDGKGCLLEWKTTSSRYPEEPDGLLALDPQLVCYSWITGISDVAQVVFVRKRLVEVQYLRTTITDEQRREFGRLVEDTVQRIEACQFMPHSGIRFPQNPCTSCPYVGLCLGRQELVEKSVIRRPGEDLDWVDELNY